MSNISGIGSSSASSSTSGPSIDSQIAAINRKMERVREAQNELATSDMAAEQKETLNASYQSQMSVLAAQLQALQQQQADQQQASSGQALENAAAQKEALAAKTAESKAAGGTPNSGASGEIIDVYV